MGVDDVMPFLAMVVVQFGFAGMNITSKLAMDSGMKPLVLVAYRQVFATFAMVPFAYFFEWKTRLKITLPLLFQIFVCSLTGITANQILYFIGLELSTPTIASALINTVPAFTCVLTVIFRQELVAIGKPSGLAKVFGTIVCVGGAMLLSFYHGNLINLGDSGIHWKYADKSASVSNKSNILLGSLTVMASAISWAIWFIVQVNVSKKFPAPYTSTLIMCFMASLQCLIIAWSANHKLSDWSLHSPGRLIAALYAGVVCSALAYSLTTWSIQKKGALYVSVFGPLLLIIVAILSWALLREKVYVGTAVGSVLIVAGLYAVLWGKDREIKVDDQEANKSGDEKEDKDDMELQLPSNSNSNSHSAT